MDQHVQGTPVYPAPSGPGDAARPPVAMQIQMPPPSAQDPSPRHPLPADAAGKPPRPPPIDKTMSSASDLVKLLPSGTVLAFQALAPSFSNHGVCRAAHRYMVLALIGTCGFSCMLLSFTDSVVGRDGRFYYGLATFRGFYAFNFAGSSDERDQVFKDLSRFRLSVLDFVHAVFGALVFLAIACSDTGIQNCLFSDDVTRDFREVLANMPLAAGFLASMVFMIFPTTRKSIGYTDMTPHTQQ